VPQPSLGTYLPKPTWLLLQNQFVATCDAKSISCPFMDNDDLTPALKKLAGIHDGHRRLRFLGQLWDSGKFGF
jgi:hypothetical protein